MSDTNEVSRQFLDLQAQLVEDGYGADTDIGKLAKRLSRALKEDGFSFAETTPAASAETKEVTKPTRPVKVAKPVAEAVVEDDDTFVQAFRARSGFDTSVVEKLFATIEGWRLKTVEHKGSFFVIATNAPRLTDKRVKTAIARYVNDLKAVTPATGT